MTVFMIGPPYGFLVTVLSIDNHSNVCFLPKQKAHHVWFPENLPTDG